MTLYAVRPVGRCVPEATEALGMYGAAVLEMSATRATRMLYHILLKQADACVCLCVATTIPSGVHTEGGQVRALRRQENRRHIQNRRNRLTPERREQAHGAALGATVQ